MRPGKVLPQSVILCVIHDWNTYSTEDEKKQQHQSKNTRIQNLTSLKNSTTISHLAANTQFYAVQQIHNMSGKKKYSRSVTYFWSDIGDSHIPSGKSQAGVTQTKLRAAENVFSEKNDWDQCRHFYFPHLDWFHDSFSYWVDKTLGFDRSCFIMLSDSWHCHILKYAWRKNIWRCLG